MDASWSADARVSMWRLDGEPGLCEIQQTARRIARGSVRSHDREGVVSLKGTRATLLSALAESGLIGMIDRAQSSPALSLGLAAAELAVADGGAATCLLSAFLPHSVVRDFGTPEQRARYLDRGRYPHGALCLTEPPPGAGVDALTLTGRARVVDSAWLDVEKRGRFISHMEFADFVLLAVDSGDPRLAGGCLIVAEPGDEGLFDRGAPVRTLGHRLSSVTSPEFRLKVPASRILGGYEVEDGRLVPRIGYRQALDPALLRCNPVVALMTAGKLLATVDTVLAHGLPDLAAALRLVDAWADAETAASLAIEAAGAEAPATGAAARLFATAHAARHLTQYAALPGVLGWLADAQVEAVYLGAESLQRRRLAVWLAGPDFQAQLAQWVEETGEAEALGAGLSLLGWTVEFLRRAGLLIDANQGAVFPLADALCRLLAARALTAGVRTLGAAGNPALSFFEDLAIAESGAAASAAAQICTAAVFGYTGATVEALRSFYSLRAAVDSSLAVIPAARTRAAAFLLARSIDKCNACVT